MDTPEYKEQYTKIKEKLDNYEIELPANDWDVFSKKLAETQTRRRRFAWYSIPLAASIAGILFLGTSYLLTQYNTGNQPIALSPITEKASTRAAESQASLATTTAVPHQNKVQTKNRTTTDQLTGTPSNSTRTGHANLQPASVRDQNPTREIAQEKHTPALQETVAANQNGTSQTAAINFDTTGYITHPVKTYAQLENKKEDAAALEKDKKKTGSSNLVKWLAGNFQGNLGISSANGNDMLSDGSIGSQLLTRVSKADALQASPTPTTMSFTGNKTHHTPLTFGLSIGIPLSNRWEFQTGLAYTLLVTTGEIASSSKNKATGRIEQNYIGIPLSLSYSFIKKKTYSVYTTAGGRIDKGISLVEKTYTYDAQDKLINLSHYQYSISGLQFSLDAGVGASYRIYRFINCYLETGGAWYIPSNQPESAHTEHPLNIALKTGVRFNISK